MATAATARPTAFTAMELDAHSDQESDEFGGFSDGELGHERPVEEMSGLREKDDEELELEELLFGASGTFRSEIGKFAKTVERDEDDEDRAKEQKPLQHLTDDQLFFLDTEPDSAMANLQLQAIDSSDKDDFQTREPPAWEDSDDERITISLASATRFRKLRKTEEEDLVSGKEYIKRLKRQYWRLNPTPQWVDDARKSRQGKKRRRTENGEELTESSASEDGMDLDEEFSGHTPLADLLRDASSFVQERQVTVGKRKLAPEVIDIQRTKQICNNGPSAITCLQMHPELPLLIASGPSARLDLYHLHSQPPAYSSKITSLWIKRTPLTCTAFHPLTSDARIFLSARRRYFHVWNLASGQIEKVTRIYGHQDEQRSMERFKISPTGNAIAFLGTAKKGGGVLNVLDTQTLQWIAQARIEGHGGIAEFEWWSNGQGLCAAGKNGDITEWSLAEKRTIAKWKDEGAVGTTTLTLGGKSKTTAVIGGDAWIAIGSSAGIVNVYSRRKWMNESSAKLRDDNAGIPRAPKPTKMLDQLTTPISHLAFSPDGQVLCMASRWKRDALRLVHLPTCTVYRNWPTANTPFGRISAVCWGDIDGVLKLVVGNEAGKINAWDIRE